MDINQYLIERVDDQINWYDKKSTTAQKYYKRYQIAEIILAALIPLLSGYTSSCIFLQIIIGLFGATIAIIEAITKLYKFHENWIQYRSTCELLQHQKYLYLTQSFPYNKNDETIDNIFIKNVESIISSENNQWKALNFSTKEPSHESNSP
ncbi:MAG: DUF4231 domain-containing protein [Lachnospiraceae bacterium]|nr:DUF4231 domain-containing protein [Lachnospiraceae bacterium]